MSQDHYNALPEGHKLHEYTIKAVLGHGGFGITYLAWDENLNKDVAIKEYLPTEFAVRSGDATVGPRSSSDDEDYNWGLDRFVTEAQTLALFRHPSIVPVYRFFKAHGTAYMVMEYQEGESFSVLMRKHRGDLTEADLMGLVQPMLDGLAEVHRAGFLHRDVKPGNIFIRRDGSPVLLDFGAARSAVGRKSQNLTSIVTPGYAPLEQYFADGNQGPWTDIYSLAAILYQCVAGKLPPEAPARVKKDPITPISEIGAGKFSEHFLAAIDRALMVEEEERPQTTTEWRDMLLGRVAPVAGVATAADAEEADQTMVAGGFGAGATILAGSAAASTPSTPAATVTPGGGQGSVGPAGGPTGGPVGEAAAASGPAPGGFATQAQARAVAGGRSPGADSLSVGDPVTHTRSGRGGAAVKYLMIGFAAVFLIAFSAGAVYIVLGEDDALGIFTGKESQEAKRKTAEEKKRAEEAARKRAEDAALKAAEEKRRQEEAARKAEEDRKARAREEARRTEEGRKRLEAEARKKRLAEEAARRAAEEKKRKEEEARRRSGEETRRQAEARRKQEAEDARRRAEEARLREEEAARRAEEEKRKQLASRTDGVSCPMSLSGLNGRYKNAIDCFYVRKIFQSALNSGTQGTTSSWRNSRTGNRGSLTVIATIRMANNTFCRRFRQTLVASGKSYSATGVACLIGQRWQIRN